MSGHDEWNHAAFCDAAAKISAHTAWLVCNPAMEFEGRKDLPREKYMRAAVHNLLQCSALALLPGWTKSEGAKLEVTIARELGLPIFHYREDPKRQPQGFELTNATAFPSLVCEW